jgi:aryl-alcohol dehydrogenase-like predicted oxidoreductase
MPSSFATPEGTKQYATRFPDFIKAGHYRDFMGLVVSSLGLGTYLGNQNETDDQLYVEAIKTALTSGINLIDSAINYRCMRSERNIGQALRELIKEGKIKREEVVICTKGGFIPFDGEPPASLPQYFHDTYVKTKICKPEDLVAGCHCMTPAYIDSQVEKSLQNLGLDCIDLYYLHNPEMQLDEVSKEDFFYRLDHAFEELERLVQAGKIKAYGTATWNGYRVSSDSQEYLSLQDVLKTAEKAGRGSHHFKAIQLPYNLGMAEAIAVDNQVLGSQTVSFLQAAHANDIAVFTSASILQARLSRNLPPVVAQTFTGLDTDAQRAIQFVRSSPGVTAALVGMKKKSHVEENLKVAKVPPVSPEKLKLLFSEGEK